MPCVGLGRYRADRLPERNAHPVRTAHTVHQVDSRARDRAVVQSGMVAAHRDPLPAMGQNAVRDTSQLC